MGQFHQRFEVLASFSTEFIHRDVIITTAEIGSYGNNDYVTHFMLTTSFHPWIEC